MHIKDRTTVVLDDHEAEVAALTQMIVAEGFELQEAVVYALSVEPEQPDPDFVAWLSDGMVQ